MLDGSEDLRRLVRSPVIRADDQAKCADVAADQGRHLGPHGQLPQADRPQPAPVRGLGYAEVRSGRLLARERGEVSADVASAHPLTPAQMQVLSDTLRASIGKNVQINTRVDPNLLGGLVVKIGSRMIDSSLRTKLNNLKVAMKGIG